MKLTKKRTNKKKKTLSEKLFTFFIYTLAIALMLVIVYPLWFVIIASFSNPADVANGNVWFWPKEWRFDGYLKLFEQRLIWRSYFNTIFYTVAGTLFALFVNVPAGFVLTRKDMVGHKWFVWIYIIPMFFGGGLIPTYLVVNNLGLVDTIWVMIVPFAVSSFNIIVIRTFFQNSIPNGLWEAAQIDGAGTIRYFIQIVLPLAKAILAVIGLWTAIGIWNSWFNALIYLRDENLQPLQLILRRMLINNQVLMESSSAGNLAAELRQLADMMKYASIVVSTAPIMILYPFLQKYFNQGVMIGALKE